MIRKLLFFSPRLTVAGSAGIGIRRMLLLSVLFSFLVVLPLSASHHIASEAGPTIPETALEIYPHGRLFYNYGDISGMFEYTGRFEDTPMEFRYQSFTLGGYYRIHRNVKIGAFYKLQLNARHDDDWIDDGTKWIWADASRRIEHLAMVDLTPRFLLPFLPGENWVTQFKTRYEYNFSNAQQTLLLRPGITYFQIRNRDPLFNLTFQYAAYLSLNFGDKLWYSHGPYLNFTYHLTPNILVDLGVNKRWVYWSESEEFAADFPEATYSNNIYSPWIIVTGITLRLP
jgi:hypothetical protein